MNRLSGIVTVGGTITGVKIGDDRCYVDYSKVVLETVEPPAPEPVPAGSAEAGGAEAGGTPALASGTYRLEAFSDRKYTSTWQLELNGPKISGSSEWDCCSGRRTDELAGWVEGDQIRIARGCSGRGPRGLACSSITVPSPTTVSKGTWTHNDREAGWWRLDLQQMADQSGGDKPKHGIVAGPAPPYRKTPITIEFASKTGPVPGAVWWMDGRRRDLETPVAGRRQRLAQARDLRL